MYRVTASYGDVYEFENLKEDLLIYANYYIY